MKEGFLLSLYLTVFLLVQWFIRFHGLQVHNRADIRNPFSYISVTPQNLFNNETCNKLVVLTTTGNPLRMEFSINFKYSVNKTSRKSILKLKYKQSRYPELGQSRPVQQDNIMHNCLGSHQCQVAS